MHPALAKGTPVLMKAFDRGFDLSFGVLGATMVLAVKKAFFCLTGESGEHSIRFSYFSREAQCGE
jgi:hypothetical protein